MSDPPSDLVGDSGRLDALRRRGLLDAPADDAFDRLTRLATRLLRAPVALVSLVDAGRQFFLSAAGLPDPWAARRQTPLSHSFCQHVVRSGGPLCVPDARAHPVLCHNPAVPALGVVAYLGVPLATADGHVLGSFCAIDTTPRDWGPDDVAVLRDLAAATMTEVELRAEVADRRRAEADLRRARDELEDRVRERTADLAAANDGLRREAADRARAADALRASEERFRLLVEGVKDYAIFLLDPDGTVASWNAGAERIKGYRADEIVGRHFSAFYTPADVARGHPAAELRQALEQGRYEEEGERVRKDGSRFWAAVTLTALADPAGRHVGFAKVTRDVTERKRAEAGMRLRDRALASFVQGVAITDATRPDNPIVYVNPGFERMTGYAAAEVVGRNCRFLQGTKTDPAAVAEVRAAIRAGRPGMVELLNYRKDGTPFWNALSVAPVYDAAGAVTHFVAVQTDVTPFKRLEEQLRQAQKTEAVGLLAGGIAHDFNNLLTVIGGFTELALAGLAPDAPAAGPLAEVLESARRAADLTRQLLAFSRKQVLQPRPVDLNGQVAGVQKMLARVIGEDVRLACALHPGAGTVLVDPGQLEQVLLNLAVNARDAMPTGGRLTIETLPAELDAAYAAAHADVRAGRYGLVAVTDTGCGMTDAVKAQLFEPFFTTKGPGKGTGLGLATVFGIVKQSGGHVSVYSEVGRGTTFKVYLPEAGAAGAAAREQPAPPPTGTETVLLVEDEAKVRALAAAALRRAGYVVAEAAGADEAVRAARAVGRPVDLLVTDVVMPGDSGRVLAERLAVADPGLRVLFMSGYTDDAVVRHGVLSAEVEFIHKPFTLGGLLTKVREVLDKPHAQLLPVPRTGLAPEPAAPAQT